MKFTIFNDLNSLPGVGSNIYKRLVNLVGGNRIIDLLFHSPVSIIDRCNTPALSSAKPGDIVTIATTTIMHVPALKRNSPYKVISSTVDGELTIIFFNANKHYLNKILPVGARKIISGKLTKAATIAHPDYIVNAFTDIKPIEPKYPLAQGISNKMLINLINNALTLLPDIEEWIDTKILKQHQWNSWREAVITLHNPNDITSLIKSQQRLAADEFFVRQLRLQIMRNNKGYRQGQTIAGNGFLRQKLLNNLSFTLTNAQQRVIREITADQAQSTKMVRLLQGDVGSGKTVVVLFAILNAVECGAQVALMAPTEILAIQHLELIKSVIDSDVNVQLLTGKLKAKTKRELQADLMSGTIDIIVGTHALFQDQVEFKKLALVVIDEQHRFGVKQRQKLLEKGDNPDLLLMSATPIPRTLNLVLYSDMDCSVIDEKPANREPIITSVVHKRNLAEILGRIKSSLADGAKIYWVCPLIEESEKVDMAAVLDRYQELQEIFGAQVGLAHGKMKLEDREKEILRFKSSEIKILVATTVIEVGIDVPDATIMIIENAERFGLSQLHQLRGRVGRGTQQSFCVLLYGVASNVTYQRLQTIKKSNDGFYIAEQDLKIRGSGDIIGYKQSGMPNFKFFNLCEEANIPITYIYNKAQQIISSDPQLAKNKQLQILYKVLS